MESHLTMQLLFAIILLLVKMIKECSCCS